MSKTFVGRQSELSTIEENLAASRLVTLLGIGGVGKSRLAREVVERRASIGAASSSSILCDLSSARTEEDVSTAIAGALGAGLGVGTSPAARANALGAALAAREGNPTLVLDNVEPVAREVAALVERWLAVAPNVTVLVTSRVRLDTPTERVVAVEPLPFGGSAEGSDAERLFVDRARAAGATISDADLPTVTALVSALEGIPLAIELTAARARLLPVRTLLERVTQGQEVGAAGGPAQRRHAAMRQVIADSWDLLDDAGKNAMLACACFRGGFSIDSAEAMLPANALDMLSALVDASLVRSKPALGGVARFDLFETVRAFTVEKMAEQPELRRTLFRRHAEHMAKLAVGFREAAPKSGGPAYLSALSLEHDNLAVALARLTEEPKLSPAAAEVALTLAVELEPVRMLRGHAKTYVEWLRAALAKAFEDASAGSSPALAALGLQATLCEGRALSELGSVAESRAAFDRALAMARKAEDYSAVGHALCGIARLDAHAGDWYQALQGFAEAKICAVRAKDDSLLHVTLASASFHGSELSDSEDQLVPIVNATAHLREAGDERESLYWAVQLGRAYTDFDRADRARACLDDALARARAIGDRRTEGLALFALGGALLSSNELEAAVETYRRATEVLAEVGKERERGYALGYLGVAHHLRDQFEEAHAAYSAGCSALAAAGDEPNALLFSIFLTGLEADRGRTAEAASRLAAAHAGAASWSGSGMRPLIVELVGAMVEAGQARAAQKHSDLDGFVTLRRNAERRVRAAQQRPDRIESARDDYDWRDVSLDVRIAARLAERAVEALRLPDECVIVVGNCTKVRTNAAADWIDLSSRPVLRRVLGKLVGERIAAPGTKITAASLIEAGWPGEQMTPKSSANRLHVTLGTLRRLGLGELLEHEHGGWRLRPSVPLARVAEDAAGT